MRRILPILLGLLAAAVSYTAVKFALDGPARFAIRVVEAARSPDGLPAALVDAELVEQVRRVELARRLSLDTADRAALLAALSGEAGPDRQYPPSERPLRQRERATRGLRATLEGRCSAARWPEGGRAWLARITGPTTSRLPDEVVAAQEALRQRLAQAEAVRVTCAAGEVGLLLVRGPDGERRVAEIFPTRAAGIERSPFDPSMK